MKNDFDIYSDMLVASAKKIFEVIEKPEASDENKILISSINALTTTVKVAIQNEVLKYRLDVSNGKVSTLVHMIGTDE